MSEITNEDLDFAQYKSKIYIGNQDFLSKEIVRYTSVENLRLILNLKIKDLFFVLSQSKMRAKYVGII